MKVEVNLTITTLVTSNNFLKSLIDLRVGYYHQGGTLYASPHHNQYRAVFTNLQTAPIFSFHLPACFISSRQGMFFIYTCVVSHKFVLASLRKPCNFFPWILVGILLLLFLSQPKSRDCFILKKMTIRLMLVCSFPNFMISLNATYIRHSRDNC